MNVEIEHQYHSREVVIWVWENTIHGEKHYQYDGENVVTQTTQPGAFINPDLKPFIRMPISIAEVFLPAAVEALARRGLKPENEHTLSGRSTAMEANLSDMRNVVERLFNLLDKKQ